MHVRVSEESPPSLQQCEMMTLHADKVAFGRKLQQWRALEKKRHGHCSPMMSAKELVRVLS